MNKFLSASKLYLSQVVKIEEPISTGWKLCAGCIALILYEIYLYTWRQVVQPYPDFMYLEFYQMFLDYLAISSHSGNDFFEILGKLRAESYPGGFFVFPWFIALLGIQNIFLEDPWKINFFLTVPMALIPTVMDWDRKRTLAFLALFFFFPATQIILKSWNIQSMIAIYLICAFTCYWSNLKEPSPYKIVLFTFFAWISVTIKHMGVLYIAMIFPILLVWRFLRRESVINDLILALILANLALPFYPPETFSYLITVVAEHSTLFTGLDLLGVMVLVATLSAFGLASLHEKMGVQAIPDYLTGSMMFLIFIFLSSLVLFNNMDDFLEHVTALLCLVITIGSTLMIHRRFNTTTPHALWVLILITISGWSYTLYIARIANNNSIFLFPLLLFLLLWIHQNREFKQTILVGFIFVAASNFFPSSEFFERWQPPWRWPQKDNWRSYHSRVYDHLFHTSGQNPLGWQRSELTRAREQIIKILEGYEYSEGNYEEGLETASLNLPIYVFGLWGRMPRFQYNFPNLNPHWMMDDDELKNFEISLRSEEALHETSYSSAGNYYDKNSATVVHSLDSTFDIFLGWEKKLPRFHLIIIPQKDQMLPDQKNKSVNIEAEIRKIQTRLKDPEYSIMKSDLKGIFLLFIDSKAELLQDYREHKFTFLKTEYRFLIHNSIEPRKKAYKGPNYYAREHFNLN